MIVDQIDSFKTWLTAVLKPMCEADPAKLAKYVIALIKKDKSEDELRKSMIGQLDVFLEGETGPFVDLVFQTLATKDYINVPVIPNTNPPNPNVAKTINKEPAKESKIIIQPSELPNLNEAVNGNAKKDLENKRDRENRKTSDTEREDRPVRRRSPIRHRSLSRNRSRSRSWDRAKRSRSREKSRERLDQHRIDRDKRERPRVWRNKSPPRRYDRRRLSRTPSPIRVRSRSRSPRHSHRNRYRNNRSSASRSRSRSLEKKDRRDSAKDKDVGSRPGTPLPETLDADGRNSQNVPSMVVSTAGKKRCRDFDEKGYCMRGEMCPFDHGIDPVVLEDAALTRVLTYNPNGAPPVVASGIVPNPILNPPGHPMMGQRMPLRADNPYNPQAPHMWRDGRFRGPRPMGMVRQVPPMGPFIPPPNHNRELIPVPVMDNKQPETYNPMYNHPPNFGNNMDHENMYKKKIFDFNRLGPRNKNPQNCSLELKKVPQGLNSITHLNNHFGKFGKIVNIQVQYEGDPEGALITFSSHAEANAAYRSTEAVLNNRFIKVFWHNVQPQIPGAAGTGEGKQENVPPAQQRSIKDRLGGGNPSVAPNTNKVLNLVQPKADETQTPYATDEEKKPVTKEESKQQATEAIIKNQELIANQVKVKKNQDVQRKQVLKIQSDLRKKKQELLDKQLVQQKILIEKMEKLPAGPQRDVVKDTIKKTQEAIEEIKKDLETAALTVKNSPGTKKTKEETQKELLDTELDLITKQQEGADTSEIQKKILELKARVANAKPIRGRGIVRRYAPIVSRHLLSKNNLKPKPVRSINRTPSATSLINSVTALTPTVTTAFQKHTVDHRPTRLLVSGYETDEQVGVLSHFQQYGEIADYEIDSSLPSITLNYKTRKEAEMALLKGKNFQDRTLSITWSNNKQLNRQKSSGSITRTVLLSETDEDQLIDSSLLDGDEDLGPEISEEALLQDDDDEDEEDRSWRR